MKNHELVSITKAADLLGKNRQTIVRAMRGIEPDGIEMKQPRYLLATIMKALDQPRNNGGGKSQEAGLTEARADLARDTPAQPDAPHTLSDGEMIAEMRHTIEQLKTRLAEYEHPAPRWMPLKAAAFECGLDYEWTRKRVRSGLIEASRNGGRWVVNITSLRLRLAKGLS